MRGKLRRRKDQRLAALEEFRRIRRIASEDVTVLGEQLADLHVETLTDHLGHEATRHYQLALEAYERAKTALAAAEAAQDASLVVALDPLLDEGRFQRACVLALRDGEPLPERRGPCFFNPQHGPSRSALTWAPPNGVDREIDVCGACAQRLRGGEAVDVRMVRIGDRHVPWWQTGAASLHDLARAHTHDGHTPATSLSVAEAHVRAGISGMSGPAGPAGPLG